MKLRELKKIGFDGSYRTGNGSYKVSCYQCEALVINGVPTHETGCPNQTYECKGCWNRIDYPGYCQDCQ
jgi:hypothetical protein